jgi:hypothetical protein
MGIEKLKLSRTASRFVENGRTEKALVTFTNLIDPLESGQWAAARLAGAALSLLVA